VIYIYSNYNTSGNEVLDVW